ncbi:MAG: DUF420 domain-containing protein [Bacteroidetes bacterium]|nr:DUF420 domain-containing protein [Bacteroidota bacterium]
MPENLPEPILIRNDKKAGRLIWTFSIIIFCAVAALGNFHLNINLHFDVHIFAKINAFINTLVSLLLIAALIAVKNKKYLLHKKLMISALILSVLFLISYICHHLLAGEAKFGDMNHDGFVSNEEMAVVGKERIFYLILLATHILLAAVMLPFILFTAYRGLVSDFMRHKKLARITWPVWFYISVSGPLIYWMISPYY